MGFPEERAKLALRHFKNNVNMAMEHLLISPDDSNIIESNPSSSAAPQ
jgi:hypothetical protein